MQACVLSTNTPISYCKCCQTHVYDGRD